MNIQLARLKELLHYDPATGVWTWLKRSSRHSKMWPGTIAGRVMSNGRRQIRIDYGFYYSARLAWLYMTGEWPKDQIDHINRNKSDDRWKNLREATQVQNSFNRDWAEQSGSTRGIYSHGHQFSVHIGGWYLGLYPRLADAKAIRDLALWYKTRSYTQLNLRRVNI